MRRRGGEKKRDEGEREGRGRGGGRGCFISQTINKGRLGGCQQKEGKNGWREEKEDSKSGKLTKVDYKGGRLREKKERWEDKINEGNIE